MTIGIDIGGTKIRGGLLDHRHKIKQLAERPTGARRTKQAVLDTIQAVIDDLDSRQVRGIGLAVRGQINHARGVIKESTMMPKGFKGLPLARLVQQRCGRPVRIDNDVHCFALAESLLGAGQGKETVVGLALGTGIGGGTVIKGQVRHGAHEAAGELGHMIVRPDSYKWNCGQRGCLESLCSGSALVYRYKKLTGKRLDSFAIEDRCKAGEPQAKRVFRAMGQDLAVGLANIIQAIDPDVIVIGGGFGKLRFYVDPAIKAVKKHLVFEDIKKTPIRYAKLGDSAGLIGAALLLRKKQLTFNN